MPNLYLGIDSKGQDGTRVPSSSVTPSKCPGRLILPTMWSSYDMSGYERVFRYGFMNVILFKTARRDLTPGAIEGTSPNKLDIQYRIRDLTYTPGRPSDPADELNLSAFGCAINILNSAGARCTDALELNAYQLDLFMFKNHIREVSESPHDVVMGDSIFSDVSPMGLDGPASQEDEDEEQEAAGHNQLRCIPSQDRS